MMLIQASVNSVLKIALYVKLELSVLPAIQDIHIIQLHYPVAFLINL